MRRTFGAIGGVMLTGAALYWAMPATADGLQGCELRENSVLATGARTVANGERGADKFSYVAQAYRDGLLIFQTTANDILTQQDEARLTKPSRNAHEDFARDLVIGCARRQSFAFALNR